MAGWIGEVETHIEGQVITFQGQRVVPRMMRAYNRAAGIATLVLVAFVLWVASSESRIDSGVWAWALLVYAAAVLGGSIYLRVARTEQVAIRVPVQEIEHPKRTFNWPLIVLLFFLLGPIIAGIYAGMAGRRYIRLRTVMEDDGRVRRYRLRATSADNSMELLHEIAAAGGPAA